MSKQKPGASTPKAGANHGKAGAGIASSGARKAADKNSANPEDSHRLGNRLSAWSRKSRENHSDERLAVKSGGSTNSLD